MPEPKERFTRAFRDEAVRLVQTSGRSRREITEALGIGLSTLRNWINTRRGRAMDEPPPDHQEDMAAELKRLRRENEVLHLVDTAYYRKATGLDLTDGAYRTAEENVW